MKTFYFHPTVTTQYRGQTVKRRATVAAIADLTETPTNEEGNTANVLNFRFGISVCSEKDQFLKRYGRDCAMGKARSKSPTHVDQVYLGINVTPTAKFANETFVKTAVSLLNGIGYTVQEKKKKKTNTHEPALDTN